MRLARSASLGRAAIIMIQILGWPGYFTMANRRGRPGGVPRLNFITIQFSHDTAWYHIGNRPGISSQLQNAASKDTPA